MSINNSSFRTNNSVSLRHQNEFLLHAAAKERNVEKICTLIESKCNVNELNDNGNTPLHTLLSEVCYCEDCKSKVALITEQLLNAGADKNIPNGGNDVPLFLAIKNEWEKSAMILLLKGADTTIKLKNDKILAQYLMEKIPNSLSDVLDHAVERGQVKNKQVLLVNFSYLLQYSKQSSNNVETEFLYNLLGISQHTNLFQHPVTELFMYLKYQKLFSVIVFSIIIHLLTLCFYTTYIIYLYISICGYDESRNNNNCIQEFKKMKALHHNTIEDESTTFKPDCIKNCERNNDVQNMSIVLAGIWIGMICCEIIVLVYSRKSNLFTTSNFMWLGFFILMPITLWPSIEDEYYIATWRYPVAASGVWLVWALCILQLNKIPFLTVYLGMFIKVSIRIVLLALLFIPLLVGFSIGFFVMNARNIESEISFITLISLMIGGPDYDDFYDKDREKNIIYRGIAMILFVLFLILMCVVFINFLLGLTISDVKELWEESEQSSKKDQLRLMYLFDRLKLRRFHIFKKDKIPDNNNKWEYILHIKNHSKYFNVSENLMKRLKILSIRSSCSSQKKNISFNRTISLNSTKQIETSGGGSKSGSGNGNINKNFIQGNENDSIVQTSSPDSISLA